VIDIGPGGAPTGNDYQVTAGVFNHYRVIKIDVIYTSLLNQTEAAGLIAAWYTTDIAASVPSTADNILNQCDSSQGKRFFASGGSMMQTTWRKQIPTGPQPMYSTGGGDSTSSGTPYQPQGKVIIGVVDGKESITNYGRITMKVTVIFTNPGAAPAVSAFSAPLIPTNTLSTQVWAKAEGEAILNVYQAGNLFAAGGNYLVIADSESTGKAYPHRIEDADAPPLGNRYYMIANTLPTTYYNSHPITISVMAWRPPEDETPGGWIVDEMYRLNRVLVANAIVPSAVEQLVVDNVLRRILQQFPTIRIDPEQLPLNVHVEDEQIPLPVKVDESQYPVEVKATEPLEIAVTGQPIEVHQEQDAGDFFGGLAGDLVGGLII
jgi:hypothetical protein